MLILSVIVLRGQSPQYLFEHITTQNGLASNFTKFIFQDSRGFYWIGFDKGYQKFDGLQFTTTLYTNDLVVTELFDETRVSPVEDRLGTVYVLNRGIVYANHTNGGIDTVKIIEPSNIDKSIILSMSKDADDNLWFVTYQNIYRYDRDSKKAVRWINTGLQQPIGSYIEMMADKHAAILWLVKNYQLFRVNTLTKTIAPQLQLKDSNSAGHPVAIDLACVWMDSQSNCWFSSWNGCVYRYNILAGKMTRYDPFHTTRFGMITDNPVIAGFTEDKQGRIWMGCVNDGRLIIFDTTNSHFIQVPANNHQPFSLHCEERVFPMFCDREGNVWAGSDNGINIHNAFFQSFTNIDENVLGKGFHKPYINQVFQSKEGDIYLTAWGKGWWLFDKNFTLKKQFWDTVQESGHHRSNAQNYPWCFTEDLKGNVWIGCQRGLLGMYNPLTRRVVYRDFPQLENKTIRALKSDANGNIWIGLYNGKLARFNPANNDMVSYPHPPQKVDYDASIGDIAFDKSGKCWIASEGNGLYSFDTTLKKYTDHYLLGGHHTIYDNFVHCLTVLNDSVISVGYKYKGFRLFNTVRKTFTDYTCAAYPELSFIRGIAAGSQNNVWIATNHGLLRMDLATKKIVSFSEQDGLLQTIFYGNILPLQDGKMVIPAESGAVVFTAQQIRALPAPPNVLITGVRIFDKTTIPAGMLESAAGVRLNYDQNFVSIGFASTSFSQRQGMRYEYQLEGVDKDWVSTTEQHAVNYTNLQPGKFLFRVRCENREGLYCAAVTQLLIHITPPWWKTWWAYMLYIILAGVMVWSLYVYRIQQLQQQQLAQINLMVETQEAERKRIAVDLHDDIGTRLSALQYLLSSLKEKAGTAQHTEIIKLANGAETFIWQTIEEVRNLLLNLSPAILEEFGYTAAIEQLISKLNETAQIQFELVIFGMDKRLNREYELAMYRITQELITNVIKHAAAKQVTIQIGKRDNKIILMVEDDGKGFNASSHAGGYGLQNLRARTTILKGELTIDSSAGNGTSVLIQIPDPFYVD